MEEEKKEIFIKDEIELISIGCNKVTNCCDWGENNIFLYSANNFIALYDTKVK
jgi:hypothetical protein